MCGKASTCELFNFASVSFVGKAIRIEKEEADPYLKKEFTIFEVKETFSGKAGQTIRIQNRSGFSCDVSFELGETYLVFAGGVETEGFGTGFCSGNRRVEHAADQIAELRKLGGAKGDGQLRGIVLKETSQDRDDRLPMKDVAIRFSELRTGRKFEAQTKSDGRFEVSAPPGKYTIVPIVPRGFLMSSTFEEEPREIKSGGCTESYFVLSNNSRVSGRLLDIAGKPVRNARVELVLLADEKSRYLAGLSDESDTNGDFSIDQVPTGKYTLSINFNSQPEPDHPFPTTFYPSGSTRSDARILNVEFGNSIEGLTWRLPEKLAEASISGSVIWEDGSSVDGAEIKIFDMAFPGHYAGCYLKETSRSETDDQTGSTVVSSGFGFVGPTCDLKSSEGSFSVKMFSGRSYRVTARMERTISGRKTEYLAESEPFQLAGDVTIKLVLKQK